MRILTCDGGNLCWRSLWADDCVRNQMPFMQAQSQRSCAKTDALRKAAKLLNLDSCSLAGGDWTNLYWNVETVDSLPSRMLQPLFWGLAAVWEGKVANIGWFRSLFCVQFPSNRVNWTDVSLGGTSSFYDRSLM
jgi:hypothetical protein